MGICASLEELERYDLVKLSLKEQAELSDNGVNVQVLRRLDETIRKSYPDLQKDWYLFLMECPAAENYTSLPISNEFLRYVEMQKSDRCFYAHLKTRKLGTLSHVYLSNQQLKYLESVISKIKLVSQT